MSSGREPSGQDAARAAGRPRGFEPASALRQALDLLWRQGYEATSLDELTAAMGLSRSSFYACFGSKHAVLIDAVRAYADERHAALRAIVAACPDPRAAAHAMIAEIADAEGGPRGCFFVNSVIELAPRDPELRALAQAHLDRCGALMTETLTRAGCDPALAGERAAAMLAIAIGATMLRKAGIPAAHITALLAQAELLTPSPPTNPRNIR